VPADLDSSLVGMVETVKVRHIIRDQILVTLNLSIRFIKQMNAALILKFYIYI